MQVQVPKLISLNNKSFKTKNICLPQIHFIYLDDSEKCLKLNLHRHVQCSKEPSYMYLEDYMQKNLEYC